MHSALQPCACPRCYSDSVFPFFFGEALSVLPLSMTGVRGHGPSAEKRGCPFLAHRGQRLPCRTSSTCRSYLHIKNVIDN